MPRKPLKRAGIWYLIRRVPKEFENLDRRTIVRNSTEIAAAAEGMPDVIEALLAIIRPVVECNRTHIEIGRTHLRELVFGDPEEPHHRDALILTLKTEEAVAAVLRRDGRIKPDERPRTLTPDRDIILRGSTRRLDDPQA